MKMGLLDKISIINSAVLESRMARTEKDIVKIFVDAGRRALKADYGYAFKWNEISGNFEIFFKDSKTPFISKIPRRNGITAKVFKQRNPFFIDQASRLRGVRSDAKKFMKGVVVIPVIYEEERYGVIDICFYEKHIFTEEEKMVCEYLGNNAAQAIITYRLFSSLQDFKNRLDRSLDSVFIFDPVTFKIEYATLGLLKQLGFSEPELLKKDFFRIQTKIEKKDINKILHPLIWKLKDYITLETFLKTKDDKRIPVKIFLQLSRTLWGPQKFLAVVHDMTQYKKTERESQKLLKQKDEFFNIASHELKTPVTTIKGFSQMLAQKLRGSDKKTYYFAEKINTQAEKLNNLINDLLDVSHIETGKLELEISSFELNNLLEETIENLRMAISDHPIYFKNKGSFWVKADEKRIERVLINLINNAAKYSPSGSKIKVCLEEKDGKAVVEVEDFGFGISQKDSRKIFNRFFQSKSAKNSSPGLGLGLYIASSIIRHHGGVLSFKSKKKNKGTIFYFTLPYYRK